MVILEPRINWLILLFTVYFIIWKLNYDYLLYNTMKRSRNAPYSHLALHVAASPANRVTKINMEMFVKKYYPVKFSNIKPVQFDHHLKLKCFKKLLITEPLAWMLFVNINGHLSHFTLLHTQCLWVMDVRGVPSSPLVTLLQSAFHSD